VASELRCPRCHGGLPALDIAHCARACGVWVSAFAATEVLSEDERRADRLTRWWRMRAPCPLCDEQMTLRGLGDHRFQGCDGHGYWLDADVVPFTGLARGVDEARLEAKRQDEARLQREQHERVEAERKRAQDRLEARAREAALAEALEGHDPRELIEKMARRIEALEARTAELEQQLALKR
ncbi:MAG TPA: hypothetical protein VHW23_05980, partial [Kofleriaceae bacterium]|nr:hypothetical protein [Kofleriaceae bacterium]